MTFLKIDAEGTRNYFFMNFLHVCISTLKPLLFWYDLKSFVFNFFCRKFNL